MFLLAVIVTHRRPAELRRLLVGLADSRVPLGACVISDHAPGGGTRDLAEGLSFPVVVRDDASNPGPGAGWARGARLGLERFPAAEAVWYLDDDVVIAPDTLGTLIEELRQAKASAIAPLLADEAGKLWAFPEPVDPRQREKIREAVTPADARKLLGDEPLPFCWCTGASFLVTRPAIERFGLHREDFWMLGEDLEYSMRIAAQSSAVFTCKVVVPHLPPPPADAAAARRGDYVKFCSLLQNLTYLAFHSPHSRHMKHYLAGNFRRFFRSHGWNVRTVRDAAGCFLAGSVGSQPAGGPAGAARMRRIAHYDFQRS